MTREQRGPRIFVSGLDEHVRATPDVLVTLSNESSHHIRDVLRLRQADQVELADPATGTVFKGEIESLVREVGVRIIDSHPLSTSPLRALVVLCALCKGPKNDLICDWATELGATHIVFWQATRSVVRLRDAGDIEAKEARLSKIALAAAQQSRQAKPPKVTVASSLSLAVAAAASTEDPTPRKIVCSLSEGTVPIHTALSDLSGCSSIHLAIGPEGDLTSEEEQLLTESGFAPVCLGNSVLRSELAVVAAMVATKGHLDRD